MTAIAGVFSFGGAPPDERVVRRMLARMRGRGSALTDVSCDGAAALAVARHDWELGPGFSGPVLVVQDGDCVVAADASLYYRDDLRRAIAAKGVRTAGQTPSHLILAAYRAWGERCAEHLEGDFAFVLWDRRAQLLLAARDLTGSRPLFYAQLGKTLVVASSIEAVLEHPACPEELNLTAIAIDAAGLVFLADHETCYRSVFRVHGGRTLTHTAAGSLRQTDWQSPIGPQGAISSFEDGARELLVLLSDAVAERLDHSGPSCVWMSGGRDSTAIFGAGQQLLQRRGDARRLLPVSARFGHDDPWSENDAIAAIGNHWRVPIRWVELEAIPLVVDPQESASRREEPWTPEYEHFLRTLLRGTEAAGARVALNGHGGDLLFYSTRIVLADLLSSGRLVTLWHEWRSQGARGGRTFFKWAIEPLLPPSLHRLATMLRGGRRLHGHLEHPIPGWLDAGFVRSHNIEDRVAAATPRCTRGDRSIHEMKWLLTRPHFARVMSRLAEYGLEVGVETRAPLLDSRVITFAMSRPPSERRLRGDTKRLLRQAMRGLLPNTVLAPRPFKTGRLRGHFYQGFGAAIPVLREIADAPLLAEFGILDLAEFRRMVERSSHRTPGIHMGPDLLATLHAELWLRAHTRKAHAKLAPRECGGLLLHA